MQPLTYIINEIFELGQKKCEGKDLEGAYDWVIKDNEEKHKIRMAHCADFLASDQGSRPRDWVTKDLFDEWIFVLGAYFVKMIFF